MDEKTERIQALYRRASEELISDSSLRDALDDDQAGQLLQWALAQVRARAEVAADLPPIEGEAALTDAVRSVRRVMRRVNRLVEKGAQGSNDMYVAVLQFAEALHDFDLHALPTKDVNTLQQLAQNPRDLSGREVFSRLIELINPGEEE